MFHTHKSMTFLSTIRLTYNLALGAIPVRHYLYTHVSSFIRQAFNHKGDIFRHKWIIIATAADLSVYNKQFFLAFPFWETAALWNVSKKSNFRCKCVGKLLHHNLPLKIPLKRSTINCVKVWKSNFGATPWQKVHVLTNSSNAASVLV